MQTREKWRSGLGFVLAAAGSAVGLGNLWGFAYRSSQGWGACIPIALYLGCSSGMSTSIGWRDGSWAKYRK